MGVITGAILPIFALIAMGFIIKSRSLIADEFWLPCERLNYFYLFPSLMFSQVATANFASIALKEISIALLGAVAAGGLLLFGLRVFRAQPGPVFSSVIQGALRPNTYIGVAAATALYGKDGMVVTAMAIAISIPLLNMGSIILLAIYSGDGPIDKVRLFKTVFTNPVIVSVLIGIAVNFLAIPIPVAVSSTLNILGVASLPLGLLAVGAGLDIAAARASHGPVMQSTVVKLGLVPFATFIIGRILGLKDVSLDTVVLFNSLPCTPSTYIMARLLGGDHRIAAGIISVQTALAALTIPLVLIALSWSQGH